MTLLPHQRAAVARALTLEGAKSAGLPVGPTAGDPEGGTLFTSYGILGDAVGSGKSLIALSLVKAPPPPASYCEYVVRGGGSQGDGRDVGLLRPRNQLVLAATGIRLRPVNAALFIVPHAVFEQWETYVGRDTTLRARFIKCRRDATDDDLGAGLDDLDAVFVSATMFPTFRTYQQIYRILWSRIFVDEADSIHFTSGRDDLHARFYWFLTANWLNLFFPEGLMLNLAGLPPLPETPRAVQERVAAACQDTLLRATGVRCVNLVRQMCKGSVSMRDLLIYSSNACTYQATRLLVRSTTEFLRESAAPPPLRRTEIVCATPPNIAVLNSHISPEMLERLNAGDLSGALTLAGMATGSTTEITAAVTEQLRGELANAIRTHAYKQSITYSSDTQKQRALETCQQKIASLRERIAAIEERLAHATTQNCPICYCDVSGAAVTPCCQQVFCFPCLCESLRRVAACPLCRERLPDLKAVKVIGAAAATAAATATAEAAAEENAVVLTDLSGTPAAVQRQRKPLNKSEAFLEFVTANRTSKILLFSAYDASFATVAAKLEAAGIHSAVVGGSGARIHRVLTDFTEGKYTVLFLNARNMGAGLNIDAATDVVLYHRMATELEDQIVGRAARLGRTAPLHVVHLLHENERGVAVE